ncbi:branched-chain amino acid ABC transporter permease [Cumulibacter manganitolerans]|uniref:branched-chain amino acid ABC transporter permease n=1 Tax=Cumulibacter manganitolerans TaxID=1884992 RepID=UPI0012972D08|nr:branched-chain amino acid ABC transporter permease [Cumulibacter manganitolerans]
MSDTNVTTAPATAVAPTNDDISHDPAVKALVKPTVWQRWRLTIGMVIFAVVMFLLPLYLAPDDLSNGVAVMTAAVGGFGLTMLLGQAGLLSLAHSAFMLVGAISYTVLASQSTYKPDPDKGQVLDHFGIGLPPLIALIGAVLIAGLAGGLFAPVSGRVKGIYLGLASLALVYIMFFVSKKFPELAGHASGRPVPGFSIFGFDVDVSTPELFIMNVPIGRAERLWWLYAILMGIAYVLMRGAINGRIGRAWRAVRDNEAMATVMGVNVARTKMMAFIISSAYAGLAGVMAVWQLQLLTPDESAEQGKFSLVTAISYLALVVIGGMGSLLGAVLGALIVFGMPPILNAAMQTGGAAATSGTAFSPTVIATFIYGALIVLIIMFEPRGFAGIGDRILGLFTGRGRKNTAGLVDSGDQPGGREDADPTEGTDAETKV